MIRVTVCALLLYGIAAEESRAQGKAPSTLAASTKESSKPAPKATASPAAKTTAAPAAKNPSPKPAGKDSLKGAMGAKKLMPTGEAVTTEVYADEAYFDSKEYLGTFTGHVIVRDPRFNIQADKLTIYLSKGEEKGLDHAVAEGNVAILRDAPAEEGGPPVRTMGRADKIVYTAKDGNVELSGTPRVASGLNSHQATSPDTVMIINAGGQLTTRGPSRTEIRQEAKAEPTPKP